MTELARQLPPISAEYRAGMEEAKKAENYVGAGLLKQFADSIDEAVGNVPREIGTHSKTLKKATSKCELLRSAPLTDDEVLYSKMAASIVVDLLIRRPEEGWANITEAALQANASKQQAKLAQADAMYNAWLGQKPPSGWEKVAMATGALLVAGFQAQLRANESCVYFEGQRTCAAYVGRNLYVY
jgi:hypothetical protein